MNTSTVAVALRPTSTHAATRRSPRRGWMARLSSRLGAFGVTAALGAAGLGAVVPMMCTPAVTSPAATLQQQVVTSTNQHRAAAGLRPLRVDARLTYAAQAHATDQADRDVMSHAGSDGSNAAVRFQRSNYPTRNCGENVAAGYGTADQVVAAWMASPGHRANILSGAFDHIGIGIAYAADGTPYWAMALGRTW